MATELLTEKDLASMLGIPERSAQHWRYAGKGPRYMKLGKHVRYKRSDVEAWLNDQYVKESA